MPFGSRLLLSAVPVAIAVIFACGGDGDDATPTRSPTASRTETPNGGDEKQTPDGETPDGGPTTTANGEPGPTPAPEGTPAVAPPDQSAYLQQFQGRDVVRESCAYDPRTFVVDCPDRGRFAIDPPLVAQDITCDIGIVDGNAEFINCRSQEPLQAIYYEIQ